MMATQSYQRRRVTWQFGERQIGQARTMALHHPKRSGKPEPQGSQKLSSRTFNFSAASYGYAKVKDRKYYRNELFRANLDMSDSAFDLHVNVHFRGIVKRILPMIAFFGESADINMAYAAMRFRPDADIGREQNPGMAD